MMNGGGLKSMIKVAAIVSPSSCYAGIFEGTGLLKPIQGKIEALSRKITPFGATFAVAAVASRSLVTRRFHHADPSALQKEIQIINDLQSIWKNTAVVLAPLGSVVDRRSRSSGSRRCSDCECGGGVVSVHTADLEFFGSSHKKVVGNGGRAI